MFAFILLTLGFIAYGVLRHVYTDRINPLRRKKYFSMLKKA